MGEVKLGVPSIGDTGYEQVQILSSVGAICSVVIADGKQAIYRDGVQIGWVYMTECPDNKYGKQKSRRPSSKPKPNTGPVPSQQKWKQ